MMRTFFLLMLAVVSATSSAETLKVPDDYATIQGAIDHGKAGDQVLVDAGTYKERIRLADGMTLKSSGDDSKGILGLQRAERTIIDGSESDAKQPGVAMGEGSTLDGFTVTGVGKYDDAKWNEHHRTQGRNQSHEHIGVPGIAGIAVTGVGHCKVTNNIVHHIGYTGIAIQGAKGKHVSPLISGNVAYRNMGGGIGSMNGSTATIERNTCFENFYAGIGHDNASPRVIDNVCYKNVRAGIGISEHSRPLVRGNKCYQNRRAGIGIRTGHETRPIVQDNDCYLNDMAGIGVDEGAAPIIRHNRCYENTLAGIGCQNESQPIILGNQCYRNRQSGIGSRSGAQPWITDNECYENERAGIGQSGDAHTTLIRNHCHHNKATGIGFDAGDSGTSTLLDNRVVDNALVAVGIHSGWNVSLTGNELSRDGGLPPIVMIFEGAEATLYDNTIRGGGVAGIRVAGKLRAVGNRFQGTKMRKRGPPNFAVWALKGSDIMMSDNQVSSWRHALQATEAAVEASSNTVSDFSGTAFVVKQPSQPANLFRNVAISNDDDAKVLSVDGATGNAAENVLRREK